MSVQTTYRKDYRPPTFKTTHTDLHVDIRDGQTRVTSRLQVLRQDGGDEPAALRLDGSDLQLVSVAVAGAQLAGNEYQRSDEALELFAVPARCEIVIETLLEPEANTSLEGLYKSGSMYCTQCEAEGFRKITYYQDRPDVLSRFTTTLEADAERYPTLLANGNKIADELVAGGRRRVTWEDPFPKPSYLFALVAGDLALLEDEFVTSSGRRVVLQIYSEPHNIGQCDYAMGVLKRAMRWDEEVFGREYDLDIFMVVAVEDFNMGAMENKGLNIFNTSCVLASADTATDAAYQRVEAVVAHEYFHNWSGNRVTCRDWFQLSLKEGFTVFRDAEFSSDMNSRPVKRIEDVNFLRSVQFAEDAGPMAHSIRPDSYMEISNFYTTTIYEKGAEVVRMLHTMLGPARFRSGSDLYFARHDGEAATTDDFLAAMAEHSEVQLDQFARWYQQAGTPQLTVQSAFADDTLTLTISQHTPPTPGQDDKPPLHIPLLLGLLDAAGRELVGPQLDVRTAAATELRADSSSLLVHLVQRETTLQVAGLAKEPAVSLLRGFSAPVRVDFPRGDEALAFLAVHDSDGFARWDALQSLLVNEVLRLQDGGQLGATVVDVFAGLLEAALSSSTPDDQFMMATLLTLPDESYLFEQIPGFEVDAVVTARDALKAGLARSHVGAWKQLYERCRVPEAFSADAPSMARRALANVALSYLAVGLDASAGVALMLEHFQQADNLTDRRAALAELVESVTLPAAQRTELLREFYERWQHEALVVDLWFSLQATSRLCSVAQLQELEQHPAFDVRNPNKLRALYGAFTQRNHRQFHQRDGCGYGFLADRVLALNATNPQMAARLLGPLTRWQRYDPTRQTLMREALARIGAAADLSKDVYEVVHKSLAAG